MFNKFGRRRGLSASCKQPNRQSIIVRLDTTTTPRLAAAGGSTGCHGKQGDYLDGNTHMNGGKSGLQLKECI
jgi:hypothetical protein